jgi:hypothetical protein
MAKGKRIKASCPAPSSNSSPSREREHFLLFAISSFIILRKKASLIPI